MRRTSTPLWLQGLIVSLSFVFGILPNVAGQLPPASPPSLESLPPGYITTIAGGRAAGGDDLSAATVSLDGPAGIAVDSHGSVYVADRNNHRIRKVDLAGIVTTIAGNGQPGFG
ncbi:MAG: hypothetical protein HY646_18670, partial [Acidobacteria bacterium]|nr:hypothetical protein [Acidobacteriota bacterium]